VTRALIRCDGATASSRLVSEAWELQIAINHQGPRQDLNLRIENISHAVLRNVDDRASDFVRIAAYVYAADQSLRRGGLRDIYGKRWTREIAFAIPVLDAAFWSQNEVCEHLSDVLLFLTGDACRFEFTQAQPGTIQLILEFDPKAPLYDHPDSVILFSGGADSLCAVVELVKSQKRRPILVSHRSTPRHDALQSKLVSLLRERFPEWVFPHVSVWVHRMGTEANETTQRSRSFLFLALGTVVAAQLGLEDVFIPDNGVVSLNLPKTPQVAGTLASRSTHPKSIERFQELSDLVFHKGVRVTNPLLLLTRSETMSILLDHGCPELLQETVSCARARGRSRATPHCGVCSQCIDRRFGSLAAGLEEHDLVEKYGVDIFLDPLEEGDPRAQAESHVRFAMEIHDSSDDDLFARYGELYDCILPGDPNPDRTARDLLALLRRHADQVLGVIESYVQRCAMSFLKGELPATCLLRLVTAGDHLRSPRSVYVEQISGVLMQALPKTFQSRRPQSEHEVQDAAEAALTAAKTRLDRELPLMPFAGISTKPDFATSTRNEWTDWLFVEMKYLRIRQRLNSAVTEITSRIHIYGQQGAYILFGVYDPNRFILDDNKFTTDLQHISNRVWVAVIR
jgi:7-cyano-7-deazaguanine synthase in queuosine biosynthesis